MSLKQRLIAEAEKPAPEQTLGFRLLMTPFEALYRKAIARRSAAFASGARPAGKLPGITISVGNLAAGGTGKSPVVTRLARHLLEKGARPVILTRGYGAALGRGDWLVLRGETLGAASRRNLALP